jgi:hypothetical protein
LGASCGGSRGPTLHPVRGKVLYNGEPAVGAKVIFHPKDNSGPQAPRPTGVVGADGSFTLSSRQPNDGAPAGDYVVLVIWPSAKGGGPGLRQSSQDRLKGAYSNPEGAALQAHVAAGDNELPPFELH